MKNIFYILIICLFTVGCKTKNIMTGEVIGKTPVKNIKSSVFFQEIDKPIDFEYLKIRSKIKIDIGKSVPTVNVVFYFEKDNLIWGNANVSLLGLGKMLLKKDSIKAYEKIQNTYLETDYRVINELLHTDFVDFESVQKLLLGKLFIPIDEDNFNFNIKSNSYLLESKKDILIQDGNTAKYFNIKINYDTNFNLIRILLTDVKTKKFMGIRYDNFTRFGENSYPKNIKILIKDKKNVYFDIEYTKFENVQMDPVFSMPTGYQKRNID